jgi:hypothetical protein
VGRTVGKQVNDPKKKSPSILKDLDIKRKLYLPSHLKAKFLDQLKRDSKVPNGKKKTQTIFFEQQMNERENGIGLHL